MVRCPWKRKDAKQTNNQGNWNGRAAVHKPQTYGLSENDYKCELSAYRAYSVGSGSEERNVGNTNVHEKCY